MGRASARRSRRHREASPADPPHHRTGELASLRCYSPACRVLLRLVGRNRYLATPKFSVRASTTGRHTGSGRSWPIPSMTTSRAPSMAGQIAAVAGTHHRIIRAVDDDRRCLDATGVAQQAVGAEDRVELPAACSAGSGRCERSTPRRDGAAGRLAAGSWGR
jgi:hypothetical protein